LSLIKKSIEKLNCKEQGYFASSLAQTKNT
jgi:hypothetical protein